MPTGRETSWTCNCHQLLNRTFALLFLLGLASIPSGAETVLSSGIHESGSGSDDERRPAVACEKVKRHIAKQGETLEGVARAFGLTVEELEAANPGFIPLRARRFRDLHHVGGNNPGLDVMNLSEGQIINVPGDWDSLEASSDEPDATVYLNPSSLLTAAALKIIVPSLSVARAKELVPHLNTAMAQGSISTLKRKAAFLAQVAYESWSFKHMEEQSDGKKYEGRKDLGNTQKGDGPRFKGRGLIQITGRKNYTLCSKALGIDFVSHPEWASQLTNAAKIAAWYWTHCNLNPLADKGNFDAITKAINGGYNGKADRDIFFGRAKKAFGIKG